MKYSVQHEHELFFRLASEISLFLYCTNATCIARAKAPMSECVCVCLIWHFIFSSLMLPKSSVTFAISPNNFENHWDANSNQMLSSTIMNPIRMMPTVEW